jgi:glycosyltransferase involved in cell wall biosynthesis
VPETPTITFIGRIASNKGHEYFVEALGQLPEAVQGIMVGSFTNESEQAIQALAQRHGCQDRLSLRRWATREEILQILDTTTVFIFPSLWPETLGIVGIEALSRGVPVVASDLGGVREWLRDGENGRLVPPKSAARISEAVLELIDSPHKLIESGKRGIETIHEAFMPAQHTDRLVKIYEDAASHS